MARLGPDVLLWHCSQSRQRALGEKVRTPRHVLLCRWDGDTLVIGRVLHERMDPTRHVNPDTDWA